MILFTCIMSFVISWTVQHIHVYLNIKLPYYFTAMIIWSLPAQSYSCFHGNHTLAYYENWLYSRCGSYQCMLLQRMTVLFCHFAANSGQNVETSALPHSRTYYLPSFIITKLLPYWICFIAVKQVRLLFVGILRPGAPFTDIAQLRSMLPANLCQQKRPRAYRDKSHIVYEVNFRIILVVASFIKDHTLVHLITSLWHIVLRSNLPYSVTEKVLFYCTSYQGWEYINLVTIKCTSQ